jgi:hypothetical protein
MKTRKILTGICFVLLMPILSTPLFGQMRRPSQSNRQATPGKVEMYKIAFLTKKLDLTPAEAQKFWPIYNELDAKRKDIHKNMMEKMKESRDTGAMTEKQALGIIDADIAAKQADVDLTKEYVAKFKTVISPQQIVKLGKAEREFKEVLLRRLADRNDSRDRRN